MENNNALEVTAEMMKIVMTLQEKIQNIETENTEIRQTVGGIQGKITELNQMNEKIQNVSDDMRELGHEVEMKIQQKEHDVDAKIQQLGHNLTSADNVLMSELNHRINALENIADLTKGRQNGKYFNYKVYNSIMVQSNHMQLVKH